MTTSPPVTISKTTVEAWQRSQRETLKNFTDAATEHIAKKISDFQREAKRELELQEAKFAAGMTKLDCRIEAVADLERRLAERLTTLKTAGGFTVQDVEPVLRELVSEAMGKQPAPKDGRSVSLDDVRPIIAEQVAVAVARMREEQNEVRDVRHWSPRQTGWSHNLPDVIDVDVEVDDTPRPLRIEHVTEAVRLLRIASGREASAT